MSTEVRSTAIAYVDLGWWVLPLWSVSDGRCGCGCTSSRAGKHPHGILAPHGLLDATQDSLVIVEWPEDVNIGIRTGMESGIVVLDVDPRNGGDETFAALGDLPPTATVATGGGGKHLYFRLTQPMASGAHKLGQGLDIKADGGYVVAPPSRHKSGQMYRWTRDPRGGIADLPAKLMERLTRPKDQRLPAAIPASPESADIVRKCLPLLSQHRRDNYDDWLAVGIVCNRCGLDVTEWEAWSKESDKYEDGACDAKWPGFAKTTNTPLTLGSLLFWASTDQGKSIGDVCKAVGVKGHGHSNGDQAGPCYPIYCSMAEVTAKPIHWLWQDRFPSGMLSLVVGLEGTGKTFFALDMAARLSRGDTWPDSTSPQDQLPAGNTILLASEDHLEYTIKPRLDAMGADHHKVFPLKGIETPRGTDFFDITRYAPQLETMITEIGGASLIIVDPITAHLGEADQHSNAEVRMALMGFVDIAQRHGCAIMGISHLSKNTSQIALHRTIGSVAFSATARAVWLLAEDKDEKGKILLVPMKMNLAPKPKSLAFRIEGSAVKWQEGQIECEADSVLTRNDPEQSSMTDAVAFLRELLKDGPVKSSEAMRDAKQQGISERTLWRAKKAAGVEAMRDGFGGKGGWVWRLGNGDL